MFGFESFLVDFNAFDLLAQHDTLIKNESVIQTVKYYMVWIAPIAVILFAVFGGGSSKHQLRKNKPIGNRPSRSRTNELGSGDLAPKSVILKWTTENDEFDTKLPVEDLRGSEGVAVKKGYLIIPREQRNRHILVIAKTGSGKTTRMILPVLLSDSLSAHRSSIVIDSKPEMWDKLAGFTQKYCPHKKILLFNPLDTSRSLSWNILNKVESDTDAKLIANTVIMATDNPNSKSDSPFFRNNALSLLNSIMVGLLSDPNETLSMPRVHEIVHSGMKNLCDWLETKPAAIRTCRTFVELARSESQNADTIMSELGMRLAAWDLKDIRATTALPELDVECLISEPTLFIVELRESELEMLRPLANVIVVELLRFLTKRAESCPGHSLPIPVSLVIDEFASALGRLPDIHVKLNTLRSRNVSIVAAIQSIGQVKANYDKDGESVLSGFSTKIFMPALDFQDAEWASKETGTMTVRFNIASSGKNKRMIDYFGHLNENLQEQVQQRAVLTPDEIGRPADNISTFFLPNTPVFQGHLVPFYKVPELVKMMDEGQKEVVPLRDTPIEYEEVLPEPSTRSNSGKQIEYTPEQLEASKKSLGYDSLPSEIKEWWDEFERLNKDNLSTVASLIVELVRRNITIADFYHVAVTTGETDIAKILHAIDNSMLDEIKKSIGWDILETHVKNWWTEFEKANEENKPVVMELAKEIQKREVTIADFFDIFLQTESDQTHVLLSKLDEAISKGEIKKYVREEVIKEELDSSSGDIFDDFEFQVEKRKEEASSDDDVIESNILDFSSLEEQDETPKDELVLMDEAKEGEKSLESFIEDEFIDDESFIEKEFGEEQEETEDGEHLEEDFNEKEEVKVISNATKARESAMLATLNSYRAMGEDLLKKGKVKDFDVLINMAKEDTLFNEDGISELLKLKEEYAE